MERGGRCKARSETRAKRASRASQLAPAPSSFSWRPLARRTTSACYPMVSVYFYVPNLIGYVRVLLALVGYGMALTDYRVTIGSYLLSQLLDAADGYAARALKQSSTFGAVLDMVTDRSSTTCLCIVLAHFYPKYILGFASLVTLDMFSHWCAALPAAIPCGSAPLPTANTIGSRLRAGITCMRHCSSALAPTRSAPIRCCASTTGRCAALMCRRLSHH